MTETVYVNGLRWMRPNPLDSEVPPLNQISSSVSCSAHRVCGG